MASQVVSDQNLTYIKTDVDFEEMETLDIDSALVMSLLEESQGDERDEDRLNSLIRSLEAEIKASSADHIVNSDGALAISSEEENQSCNLVGHMENPGWSSTGLEFRWGDRMDVVPSSPSDEPMTSYIEQQYGTYEMNDTIEGAVQNYYSEVYNHEATMDQENEFRLLCWQEAYYS